MERHILGTFTNENETIVEVKRLINEEGYSPDELTLVIDNHNNYDEQLHSLKSVQIDQVEIEEESFWDKIKDTFTFGSYNSADANNILEQYGIPHDRAEHYIDALKDGEVVLLANSDAPRNNELSEVNEEVIENKERKNNMTEENHNNPLDEVNSEEETAIQNDKGRPSDTETTETSNENMGDSMDPSQADHMRKDDKDIEDEKSSSSSIPDESTQGEESKEEPDLTGQEDTVDKEKPEEGFTNKIAKGVVRPEAKSPLNTDEKDEKEPSEESTAPESDANYPEKQEDAGMKSED